MTISEHTITLSRAHKIAERLGQTAGEAKSQAVSLSASVTLSGFTDALIKRMQANGAAAITQLELYDRLIHEQTTVRIAIGNANASHGVSAVLAQIEGNKKVLSALNAVVAGQGAGASVVQLNELGDYKTVGGAESIRGSYIQAALLSNDQMGEMGKQIKALEIKNFALSDKLADLNGKTVTFEMIDDVAVLMGLTG